MAITNAIRYKGFFLDCEPIRQGNACFVAQVIITRESGQALDEYAFHELWVARAAADAVSFAKAWGREWNLKFNTIFFNGKGADCGRTLKSCAPWCTTCWSPQLARIPVREPKPTGHMPTRNALPPWSTTVATRSARARNALLFVRQKP